MTGDVVLVIDVMALPCATADVPRVTLAIERTLAALLAEDQESGRAWGGGGGGPITLEAAPGSGPDALGGAIGRALRDRLVQS